VLFLHNSERSCRTRLRGDGSSCQQAADGPPGAAWRRLCNCHTEAALVLRLLPVIWLEAFAGGRVAVPLQGRKRHPSACRVRCYGMHVCRLQSLCHGMLD
jgi:hypothetical protein